MPTTESRRRHAAALLGATAARLGALPAMVHGGMALALDCADVCDMCADAMSSSMQRASVFTCAGVAGVDAGLELLMWQTPSENPARREKWSRRRNSTPASASKPYGRIPN
jgi:hypothetical protein